MTTEAMLRHAPIILLDAREPFRPKRVGFTLMTHTQPSPSFLRDVEIVPPAVQAIEYAIWWEWDISHLLDLEHVWVFLDAAGALVGCEGSYHGFYRDLGRGGRLALEGDHPVILAQPGKHSCGASPEDFEDEATETERACGPEAGRSGLLIPHLYLEQLHKNPRDDALIHAYLQRRAFVPSWQFTRRSAPAAEQLCAWPKLNATIPLQVERWLKRLQRGEA